MSVELERLTKIMLKNRQCPFCLKATERRFFTRKYGCFDCGFFVTVKYSLPSGEPMTMRRVIRLGKTTQTMSEIVVRE